MKPLALIVFLLFFLLQTNAQDNSNSIQIAIIPFSSSGGDASIVQAVQEQVTSNFANKNRFILLDRSKTDKIKKELDAAKDNSSIYAKIVAEQGHLAGAEYIITGVVSPLEIQESQIVSTIKKIQTTTNQYHGTIRLSLQINKVETGQVIFSQPLTVVSIDYTTRNQSDIVDNILCKLRNIVQSEVRSLFPSSGIIILKIESEKRGFPEKVLINAGKEMLDNGNKNSACGVSTSGIFAWTAAKIRFDVFSLEEFNVGGQTIRREKKIAELKVDEVQGDVTVCKVVNGEKEIKSYLDDKKPLYVKIQ